MNPPRPVAALATLDLRSLALFRVLLALALLVDLLARLPDAGAFYADAGVLPRTWLAEAGDDALSLHLASGHVWFATAMLLLQCAAALALLLGRSTTKAAIVSFVLLASLHARNPLVLGAGDQLLLGLLLWGCCLPLAARWSVDLALSPEVPEPPHHRSIAALGVRLYALAFLVALLLDTSATPAEGLGLAIAALAVLSLPSRLWQALLRRLDHGRRLRLYYDAQDPGAQARMQLYCGLLAVPHAEIAPAQNSVRVSALLQAHGTFAAIDDQDHAHVGWNAVVTMLGHSLLLRWLARPAAAVPALGARLHAHFAGMARRWRPSLRAAAPLPGRPSAAVAAAALALFCLWNLAPETVRRGPLGAPLRVLSLDGAFTLARIAPPPPVRLVAPGRLADGREVDALRPGQALSYDVGGAPDRARWRRYQAQLALPQPGAPLDAYGAFLCNAWNRRADAAQRLQSFRLVQMQAGPAAGAEQQLLWRQDCVAPPA